jgi:acylphosphatase
LIRGLVQGVGFRPFIYRLALKHGLFGEVDNRTGGVSIIIQGDLKTIDRFSNDILKNAPPASMIKSMEIHPTPLKASVCVRIVIQSIVIFWIAGSMPNPLPVIPADLFTFIKMLTKASMKYTRYWKKSLCR